MPDSVTASTRLHSDKNVTVTSDPITSSHMIFVRENNSLLFNHDRRTQNHSFARGRTCNSTENRPDIKWEIPLRTRRYRGEFGYLFGAFKVKKIAQKGGNNLSSESVPQFGRMLSVKNDIWYACVAWFRHTVVGMFFRSIFCIFSKMTIYQNTRIFIFTQTILKDRCACMARALKSNERTILSMFRIEAGVSGPCEVTN